MLLKIAKRASTYTPGMTEGYLTWLDYVPKPKFNESFLIKEMLFADDAAFVSHTEHGLQKLITRFSLACHQFGLTISIKKMEIMSVNADLPPSILIYNEQLAVVDSLKYLGSRPCSNLTLDNEIKTRIGMASAIMAKLSNREWENKNLSPHQIPSLRSLYSKYSLV